MPDAPRLPRSLHAPLTEALPGVSPDRARYIGQGWGAMAFHLPPAPGDPGGDWVLRIPREGVPWAAADLEREAHMLPLLAARPFEVAIPREPRLLVASDGSAAGLLHRHVPGESTNGRPLRGIARREHLAGVGRFLATLHTTPASLARPHGVEVRDMWTEVSKPRIEETMALSGPVTRQWLEAQVAAFEALDRRDVPAVLIHGDISPDHLLADEQGRLSGVIDFAEARLSDPALDFAGILHRFDWRDLQVVLDHYDAPVDDTLLDRVRIYIAISPVYSVTDGFVARGPAERQAGLRRLAARASQARRNS